MLILRKTVYSFLKYSCRHATQIKACWKKNFKIPIYCWSESFKCQGHKVMVSSFLLIDNQLFFIYLSGGQTFQNVNLLHPYLNLLQALVGLKKTIEGCSLPIPGQVEWYFCSWEYNLIAHNPLINIWFVLQVKIIVLALGMLLYLMICQA